MYTMPPPGMGPPGMIPAMYSSLAAVLREWTVYSSTRAFSALLRMSKVCLLQAGGQRGSYAALVKMSDIARSLSADPKS